MRGPVTVRLNDGRTVELSAREVERCDRDGVPLERYAASRADGEPSRSTRMVDASSLARRARAER